MARRLPVLALPVLAVATMLGLSACQPAAPAEKAAEPAANAPANTMTTMMPSDAPPQEEASVPEGQLLGDGDRTCRDMIGEEASAKLVARCTAVSPATHPPCNADNICAVIQDEIDRSCGQYGPGETKPAECTA